MKVRDVKVGQRVSLKVRRPGGLVEVAYGTVRGIRYARRMNASQVEVTTDDGGTYFPPAGKLTLLDAQATEQIQVTITTGVAA